MKAALVALLLLLLSAPAAAQVQPLTAWWIDTGDTDSTALWGYECSVGDINGDGLSDFAVSTGSWDYSPTSREGLNIYKGKTYPDTVPDLLVPPPNDSLVLFGIGLYDVGDVNGDGSSDFIAGARNQYTYSYRRHAYLYFGGAAFDTIPEAHFMGDSTGNWTNFSDNGAGLGDINGDGFNDFAILDEGYFISGSPLILGAIYIYYGGNPPDSIPAVVIHADITLNRLGHRIAPLGDLNSDGYADWVMSDPACQGQNGETSTGVVAIYYGGNPPNTIPHTVIYGSVPGADLGLGLTTFDWNGDGQKDIFAWCGNFYPPNNHGAVWEFNVSPTMTGQPDHIFLGIPGYPGIGERLFHVDLDGNGKQDLISGAPGYALAGLVYVFLNANYSDTLYDALYYQGNFEGDLGGAGCNAGDINGDDIEDIVIHEAYGNGRKHLILGDDGLHQSGVEPYSEPPLPQTAVLLKAYPNPFNSEVVLEISAPSLKNNNIQIYNLSGQEVRKFFLSHGQRRIVWDGKTVSGTSCTAGVYWAKLTGPGYQTTTKLTLIR
jgi:hypothetical protein